MPTNINIIRTIAIEEVVEETLTVKTFVFKDNRSSIAKPGQFLMVWISGIEVPMSVMVSDKKDCAAVTIRKRGFGSTALFNKKIGDILEFVALMEINSKSISILKKCS